MSTLSPLAGSRQADDRPWPGGAAAVSSRRPGEEARDMTSQPTGEWMAVLDRTGEAGKQLLERAAAPPAPPPAAGPTPTDRLGERAAAWETSLARMEDEAKAASRDFNAEEEMIT